MSVPEGTIADVLDWVGSDPQRAEDALIAEEAGQNRSTLIAKLEAIASGPTAEEAPTVSEPEEPTEVQAPAPPEEVVINAEDATLIAGTPRSPDVEQDDLLAPDPDSEDEQPIDGTTVEYAGGAATSDGCALQLNGDVYLLDKAMTAAVKRVVDQAVIGMNF